MKRALLRYTLTLSVFLFGIINLQAQEKALIYGVVLDKDSKETLIGVTVMADENNGVITDLDGKYRLNLDPGEHTITYSFLGYEKVKKKFVVAAGDIIERNVELGQELTEIGIVVVSASQYEKNIAEETVSMDVISSDLVKNSNSRDLSEIVAKTPGVQVQDGQISIRNGSSYSYGIGTRTSVLVDGLGFTSADLGEAQLKSAPLENVDQIEVIKGASSVVYGSSALNGVVNVRTAWPGEVPKTSVTFYAGIYDKPPREELIWWESRQPAFQGYFVSHQQKVKNLQFVVGSNMDFIQSYLQDADEFRFRFNFKTRWISPKITGLSMGVNGNLVKETSGRFFLAEDLDSNAYMIAQGSQDRYVRTNIDPHLTYINDKGHRYTFNARWINIYRRGNGDDPNAVSNSFEINNQYQKNWKSGRYVLTVGVPFNVGQSRSNLYDNVRINWAAAAYAQGEVKFGNLSVVAGVRYEANKVDSILSTTIPVVRTGLNYKFGKATYLRASWGQAYRLPTIGERFVSADLLGIAKIIPNPTLKPEKGWSAEVGVKQGLKIGKWLGYFDFTAFWMEYENLVEYVLGVYPNLFPNGDTIFPGERSQLIGLKPLNVEQARIFGLEATIAGTGKIGPIDVQTLIGYTYSYPGNLQDSVKVSAGEFMKNAFANFAKRVTADDEVSQILNFRTRHLLRLDVQLSYQRFSVGYSVGYASFPERLPAITAIFGPTLEGYVEDHQKGDWYMNLRFGYEVNDRFRIGFNIKNLTNHEYASRPGKLDPPRSYTLQLRMSLYKPRQKNG